MPRDLLPLGYPDRFDVEAAAKLYLEYDKAGLLEQDETCQVFAMSVYDFKAVYARAHDLKKQAQAAAE